MGAPGALDELPADALAQLISLLPVGVLMIGPDHRILACNPAAAGFLGLAQDQVIGLDLAATTLPELAPLAHHYRDDGPFTETVPWTCACQLPDGSVAWRGGSFVPLPAGRLLCMIQDTTEGTTRDAALAEERYRLRTVIDALPDPLAMKDADGRYLVANLAAAERLHTTPSTLIGRRDTELGVPAAVAAEAQARLADTLARGQPDVAFETQRSSAGASIHVRSMLHPVVGYRGDPRVVVLDQDVTALALAQTARADSDDRHRAILAVIRETVWDWHVITDRITYSVQLRQLLGFADDDVVDLNQYDDVAHFVHVDDRARVEAELRAMAAGHRDQYESEHRLVGPGGTIWVHDRGGVVERAADGRPVRIVGSMLDITARRADEETQRRLLAEKDAIVQSEAVGFAIVRDHETFIWVNRAAATMFGYAPEELIGQSIGMLMPPSEVMPPFAGRALPVLAAGEVFRAQRSFRRKDGSLGWFDMSGARLHPATGEHIWAVIDSSALKETEEALIEARLAAEESSRAKTRFLAMMSHEIRTPLNGILGMAQILADEALPIERVRAKARTIVASGHQLLGVLSDVLDLSKIEEGRIRLSMGAFSPAQVIADVLALFAPEARRKGVELTGRWLGAERAHFLGDRSRLRQILGNLVSNAVKFTPAGKVTVHAQEVGDDGDGRVVLELTVADTGIGIPDDQRHRLFTAFSQLDDSSTRRFGGTGLGLAIVRELVDMMAGTIDVESSVEVGSRFRVRVPLPRATPAPALAEVRAAPIAGTVLVVEDHDVNRRVIELMLRRLGASVVVAVDGRAGVDAATADPRPDLVLMDIQMPELDGHDATRAIRTWEHERGVPRIPIVAITANAFDDDRAAAADAGMDDFMPKPINASQLSALVARWIARPYPT